MPKDKYWEELNAEVCLDIAEHQVREEWVSKGKKLKGAIWEEQAIIDRQFIKEVKERAKQISLDDK